MLEAVEALAILVAVIVILMGVPIAIFQYCDKHDIVEA